MLYLKHDYQYKVSTQSDYAALPDTAVGFLPAGGVSPRLLIW
jgi:hypothetical protein